jgi:hypothetical protein
LNKEVTVRFGKLKMQLWDLMCWPHVNSVPSGAVGKDCQRWLLSLPRFVRAVAPRIIIGHLALSIGYNVGGCGRLGMWLRWERQGMHAKFWSGIFFRSVHLIEKDLKTRILGKYVMKMARDGGNGVELSTTATREMNIFSGLTVSTSDWVSSQHWKGNSH